MIETLLDYMISVEVLDQIYNSILQSMDDGLNLSQLVTSLRVERATHLFAGGNELDHFL
jgi:hypothetical protein